MIMLYVIGGLYSLWLLFLFGCLVKYLIVGHKTDSEQMTPLAIVFMAVYPFLLIWYYFIEFCKFITRD